MKLLKWVSLLLITQCFSYQETNSGLVFQMGLAITPDRLVFFIIVILATWTFTYGELQFPALGKVGFYTLLFAVICTASSFLMGRGSQVLYLLFDYIYKPFVILIIAESIPHSRRKLESLSFPFLALGAYLAVNGIFEHFGPHALVWPKYILDPHVGIQFERTRGSFLSSEGLGGALIVTFLFYLRHTTRAQGKQLHWAYLMIFMTTMAIYATNQRAAWLAFGMCLVLLAVAKSDLRRVARGLICIILLGFLSGVGSKFSFWEEGTLFARRQNTVDYRWLNNLTTLEMGKANPIFGIGFGNFQTEWPKYLRPIEGLAIADLSDGNHNTYLGRFAEVGLVGLIPYLMIFYHMFRVGLRVYRQSEGCEREFALVFLLVLLSYIIGGNFSDYRTSPFITTVLYLLFGTVARSEVLNRENDRTSSDYSVYR